MSRRLRRGCEARLRGLQLPAGAAAMVDIVAHMAARRGRPIHLRPFAMHSAGPSGAWLPTETADYIFYAAATSPRHQAQIVGHELGHMACEHTAAAHGVLTSLPLLSLGAAEIMLAREAYTSDEEREAEQMADLLVSYLERPAGTVGGDRLEAALRHQRLR